MEFNREGLQLGLDLPDFSEEYLFNPYSDRRRFLEEGDPWFKIRDTFGLHRLERVRQLSFLSYTGEASAPNPYVFQETVHTRYVHSQEVANLAKDIVRRNGGTLEMQHLVLVAGALHDIATPAHGDATKSVDPHNLDEEAYWQEMVPDTGWAYLEQHKISPQKLDDIIHNRGVLGEVLDIADKISYVTHDVWETVGDIESVGSFEVRSQDGQIRAVLERDKQIGNIYQDVGIDWKNEQVMFGDMKRLENFLYLRALLFHNMYMHPNNLGRDYLFAEIVKPFYSANDNDASRGLLTPSVLRQFGDSDLQKFLAEKFGYGHDGTAPGRFFGDLIYWRPDVSKYHTHEEADRRLDELRESSDTVVLGKKEVSGFNPGSNFLVVNGRRVEPFSQASGRSLSLDRLSGSVKGIYVFHFQKEGNEAVSNIWEQAKSARNHKPNS